jgi:hypothetical protein
MHTAWHILVLLLLGGSQAPDGAEIPLVGRPDFPFSEASGHFRVQARAEPNTVAVEKTLTFTLTVRAAGPVDAPPRRLDLRELPAIAEAFYIEDPVEGGAQQLDPQTWEFVYRLKPRSLSVREVPGVPFAYYNPDIPFPARRFQVAYTDPIPLTVQPVETVPVPIDAPAVAFELATAPAVLARETPWQLPGVPVLLVVILAPPLGCAAWYLTWKRLYPNAARLARQRRSRAASQALHALRRARPSRLTPEQRAALAARVVADYLHQRFDLAAAEPTPDEAADHLKGVGCSSGLIERAAGFFRACDAARFWPEAAAATTDLPAEAMRLILAVEEDSWASHS